MEPIQDDRPTRSDFDIVRASLDDYSEMMGDEADPAYAALDRLVAERGRLIWALELAGHEYADGRWHSVNCTGRKIQAMMDDPDGDSACDSFCRAAREALTKTETEEAG
jgi:hypothetical protein